MFLFFHEFVSPPLRSTLNAIEWNSIWQLPVTCVSGREMLMFVMLNPVFSSLFILHMKKRESCTLCMNESLVFLVVAVSVLIAISCLVYDGFTIASYWACQTVLILMLRLETVTGVRTRTLVLAALILVLNAVLITYLLSIEHFIRWSHHRSCRQYRQDGSKE